MATTNKDFVALSANAGSGVWANGTAGAVTPPVASLMAVMLVIPAS